MTDNYHDSPLSDDYTVKYASMGLGSGTCRWSPT
jgi:hypothetical protein